MSNSILKATTCETVEEFVNRIPARFRKHITPEIRERITELTNREEDGDIFRENVVTHTDLMDKYSTNPENYIKAVKFVSMVVLQKPLHEAFGLAHPDQVIKYGKQVKAGTITKQDMKNRLSLRGSQFKKTQLVCDLIARATVPLALRYDTYRSDAIETLHQLMSGYDENQREVSHRVRKEAADSLLDALNIDKSEYAPTSKVEESQSNVIEMFAKSLEALSNQQARQMKDVGNVYSASELSHDMSQSVNTQFKQEREKYEFNEED